MFNKKTIEIIKSTVPILQEGGEGLITHFYQRMFKHNPEVIPFFNQANQAKGAQPKALANAVLAYAANIDNLGALGDAVELIVQKHVALRIRPEHYDIVGENLLASIKEVLGDLATDEVIEAWGEAYHFLAKLLIDSEEKVYKAQENAAGGWRDFKDFKVIKKEKESEVVTSFYLEPVDGSKPPFHQPGQFITVRVPTVDGQTTMRNYSLSDKPNQNHFRISVKREAGIDATTPEGYVSNLLHKQVNEGDQIELAPPSGNFFIDLSAPSTRPLVLMAGGIGITPFISMLLSVLEATPDRAVFLMYAAEHENVQAFRSVLENLEAQYSNFKLHHFYNLAAPAGVTRKTDNVTEGFVDVTKIETIVDTSDSDYYFCGPKPFMVNLYHGLLGKGVPLSQIHFEFFGPREDIETPPEK